MRFRFDANAHEYIDLETGLVLPHITGILKDAGLVDDRWFTDESRERGSIVHRLTTDYDLGALEPRSVVSTYRNYLLAYVDAKQMIGSPDWSHIEVPMAHSRKKFAGRPDRVGVLFGGISVVEIKSGAPEKCHPIQTAMQAILASQHVHIPPEAILRFGLYLKPNGRFTMERHEHRGDFDVANRIIKDATRRAA